MNNIKNIFLGALVLLTVATQAQLTTPQPSPTATISQKVGLTDVSITYSRPGAKDRVVFGNLVSYGKIWRTGANKCTSISFDTDIQFGGKDVKAGTYSLFTIPGEKEWTVILNSNTELWGAGGYSEEEDIARITVAPSKLGDKVETFTMDFSNFDGGKGHLNLSWENTKVSVLLETPANEAVEKQIKELLVDGPGAGTYYSAARFYLDNDKDLNQALTWINMAIEKRPNAFWYIHQKAKIQAKLGNTKEAIATAEMSLKMAKENKNGDFGYIVNNESLIAELKKK